MSLSNFEFIQKLGSGSFSSVYKVRRLSSNWIYALKQVNFRNLSQKEKESALNEIRILASISHPNIISYKEAFIDEPSGNLWQISISIVMEYAEGGDLLQLVAQKREDLKIFNENEIWNIIYQLVQGLKALHDNKIVHRDLKSANIFLTSTNQIKIGDMNVSKIAHQGMLQTQTGTPYYASPEIWKNKPYDFTSDIWSIGCVIYEITALNPPFTGKDMQQVYRKVIRGLYPRLPAFYSQDLISLINSLLQVNPALRPNCDNILHMPLVSRNLPNMVIEKENFQRNLLETIKLTGSDLIGTKLPGPKYETRDKNFKSIFRVQSRTPNRHQSVNRLRLDLRKPMQDITNKRYEILSRR